MILNPEALKLCEWVLDWNGTPMGVDEFNNKHGFLMGTSPSMLIRNQAEKVLALLATEAKGEEVRVFQGNITGRVWVYGRCVESEFWENGEIQCNVGSALVTISNDPFTRELHGEEKNKWLAAHPLPGEAITPPTPAQVKPVRKFEWVECSRFDDGAYRTIVDCIETFIHPVEIKGDSHD